MLYLAILIAFGVSTGNGLINCPPELIANLPGSLTSSTFTLREYCCIAQTPGMLPTDNVVTIVGLSDAMRNFDASTININNLPLRSNFSNSGVFAALNGSVSDFCSLVENVPTGIRIGNDIFCLINGNLEFCNAPLPSEGPYRVQVLIFRNGTLLDITPLSAEIFLKNPKDFHSIDTKIKNHSAGMIVITTILPILLALLMAIFSTMLLMKCCCCRIFTPSKCQQES